MWRSRLLVLTMLVLSATVLQAQRASGGSRGGGSAPSGNGISTGPSKGFFPRYSGFGGHHRYGYGSDWPSGYFPYWDWDDDGYFQYESPDQPPANPMLPQVIVVRIEEPRPPAPPPEPPKLIEVPQSKESVVAKPLPPTLFVLTNGERIESRHYLLTVESLHIELGRHQQTIPVSGLDLDATVSANHERGIEVTVPRDSNSVLIGF